MNFDLILYISGGIAMGLAILLWDTWRQVRKFKRDRQAGPFQHRPSTNATHAQAEKVAHNARQIH